MVRADMVEAGWKDADGKRRRSMALLEDISASGACLQREAPIPLDVPVEGTSQAHDFHRASGIVSTARSVISRAWNSTQAVENRLPS